MTDNYGLNRSAALDADLAFLQAQASGMTTADCLRAALRAYLAREAEDRVNRK